MTPAPYPASTSAKGWRFELDYECIERSSTWALAGPEARPWLLMMWMKAWGQVPCGSLPADEEVIAAIIGMPAELWAQHRKALMRGWWAADDGLMYHDTLGLRVAEMMAKRRSDSDRQAARRARDSEEVAATPSEVTPNPKEVTHVSHVTPEGLRSESSTDHLPVKKRISKPSASHPLAGGFDDFWLTWPKNERKQDKAKCLDHWKRNGLGAIAEQVIADVRVKRGTQKWTEGFVESPLVYLRGKRWEDGVEPEAPRLPVERFAGPGSGTVPSTETVAQYAARVARELEAAKHTPEERERARAAMLAANERLGRKRMEQKAA